MINPKVIDDYFARSLNNYDWLKKSSDREIRAAMDEIRPRVNHQDFWIHQRVCFLLIEALQRFMLLLDMGAGKTRIVLEFIKYRKNKGEKPKAIVFVPFITATETWVEQTAEHTPGLVCVPLVGTTEENLDKIQNAQGDLFVICYQSAVAMLAEPVKTLKRKKKKWTLDSAFVRKMFAGFDTLILDEVHRCKSVSSLTFRMCRAISAQSDYAIGLTGTPFGRDLSDLWPQFYLIDFGETLGDTLGFYHEAFFAKKRNYWGGFVFKFKKRLFKKLQAIIKNVSIRYSIDEFYDMPEKEYILKNIEPHQGIKAYAERSVATIKDIQIKKRDGHYRQMESEYLKLRQLSSGFMTLKGEDNDKLQVKFDENPKLDALQELVEAMPHGCKMIVFHHFVYTNVLISERLREMKVGHARIYGKTRDPIAELRKFKDDEKCRVLVLNSKSGSSALNLQGANYIVFFEQPSTIDRQQAERRVWRPGQLKRVFIYDFLMKETADKHMHKANAEGRDLLRDLLDGRVNV